MVADEVFSMYTVKHTNVICVTRNRRPGRHRGHPTSRTRDYREHMKRILKKRARLAPGAPGSERPLSSTLSKLLLKRLD